MTNSTTNATANETAAFDIPDPRGLLTSAETELAETLTSWGYDPAHALFLFGVLMLLAFALNYLTSGATAKLQGGNKWILFIVVFIGILWYLEVV